MSAGMSFIGLEPIARDERVQYALFLLAVAVLLWTESLSMWQVSSNIGMPNTMNLIMRNRIFCFHYALKSRRRFVS